MFHKMNLCDPLYTFWLRLLGLLQYSGKIDDFLLHHTQILLQLQMCFRWWYLSLSHVVKCCIGASETFCLLTFYLTSRNLWTLKMIITNVQHLAFVCTRLTAKGGEAAPLVFLRRTLRHHSKTTTKHYTYYIQ